MLELKGMVEVKQGAGTYLLIVWKKSIKKRSCLTQTLAPLNC